VDTREFIGGILLKPEDVTTPIVLTIVHVAKGKFDKLDLTFDDGSKLGLNATNGKKIAKAWTFESANWLGKEVELSAGVVPYNGEDQPTIILKTISPSTPAHEKALAKSPKSPIDDEIPF
jgi:hypothetical protein